MSKIREEANEWLNETCNCERESHFLCETCKQAKRVLLLEKAYNCQHKASVLYFRVSTISTTSSTVRRILQLSRAANCMSDKAAELYRHAEEL